MTLIEHLTELRRRLIVSLIALACGFVACWVLYPQILDFLTAPYCEVVPPDAEGLDAPGSCRLLVLDPLEPFAVRVSVAGYGGAALAMPVLLWQAWRFVTPALYRRERLFALAFVVAASLLFAGGAALAFWSIPRALGFLATVGGEDLVSFFSPRRYLSFVVKMALAFGLGFEFPIVLIFGQIAGIVPTAALRRVRPWAAVGIVVVGAVITPTGDPFTLLALSVPMYAFYEISILFGVLRRRRKEREEAAEGRPAAAVEPGAGGLR
ncbi:MAG: twin-arginine translocase subunit TatC [bacterium]|nr:twin-arginine translocase subunit TatC [bacterium]